MLKASCHWKLRSPHEMSWHPLWKDSKEHQWHHQEQWVLNQLDSFEAHWEKTTQKVNLTETYSKSQQTVKIMGLSIHCPLKFEGSYNSHFSEQNCFCCHRITLSVSDISFVQALMAVLLSTMSGVAESFQVALQESKQQLDETCNRKSKEWTVKTEAAVRLTKQEGLE